MAPLSASRSSQKSSASAASRTTSTSSGCSLVPAYSPIVSITRPYACARSEVMPTRLAIGFESDPLVEPARRVDVEHPHRHIAVVAEGVLHPGRHEHERAGRRADLLVTEHERHLALDDEERVVLLLVHVRLQLTPAGDLDDPEVEARRVDRAGEELHVPETVSLARWNHYWPAHCRPFKRLGARQRPEPDRHVRRTSQGDAERHGREDGRQRVVAVIHGDP